MKFAEFWNAHQKVLYPVIVILLLLIGWSVYALFIATPKPKSDKPEDLVRFVASSGFRRLPAEQQKAYLEQLRRARGERPDPRQMRENMAKLSEKERRTMFENMHRIREKERAKEALAYLKMDQNEKNAYLDQKIAEFDRRHAEMEKNRAQWEKERQAREAQRAKEQQNAQANSQQQTEQRPNFAQMRKMHMESTAPEVRAARETIMRDMMARRKATGKSMPKPPSGHHGPPPD